MVVVLVWAVAEAAVVLERAGQVGSGDVVQQRRGLRRDALGGDGVLREGLALVGVAGVAAGIVDGDRRAIWRGQVLKVPGALGGSGHGSVLVEGRRRALAGEGEEDEVLRVVRDQVRDVGRANEGEAEAVGGVAGLGEGLAAQGERLGVEGGVAAVPEDGAVRLVGIEIAEVAAATKAASAAPATSKTASSTKATATPSAGTT